MTEEALGKYECVHTVNVFCITGAIKYRKHRLMLSLRHAGVGETALSGVNIVINAH